ncbi:HlyC/CorC family transporter [candidate division WOR-3 bacterium]|nr:HlyC/CorC family transporter [candidate division WOR-3 bacterium]
MYHYLIECLALLVLLLLSAFFSSSETAIFYLPRITIEKLVLKFPICAILKKREKLLGTILFGNTLVNVGIAILVTVIFYQLFQRPAPKEMLIIICSVTYLILVFGEITPKLYGLRNSEKVALKSIVPLQIFRWIFSPIIIPIEALISFIGSKKIPSVTKEELLILVNSEVENGYLNGKEKEIITRLLDFKDKQIKEIMTPESEFESLNISTRAEVVLNSNLSHSRIPVYDETSEHIIGTLYIKDLLTHRKGEIKKILRKPYFVPDTMSARILFSQFQKKRIHIAIVVDEYGAIVGIVTLDDILNTIIA